MMDVGTRNVVERAHEFVDKYRAQDGAIPSEKTFGMGHALAHCWMTSILHFIGPYGFRDPGHLRDFMALAAEHGLFPDDIKSRYQNDEEASR